MAQLTTYDVAKRSIDSWRVLPEDGPALHFVSSLVSSLVVTTAMQPFDVVSTRLYVTHTTAPLYTGVLDCLLKTLRTEGFKGWFKGKK